MTEFEALRDFWVSADDLRNAAAHGFEGRDAGNKKKPITNAYKKIVGHVFRHSLDKELSLEIHSDRCGCCIAPVRKDNQPVKVNLADLAYSLPILQEVQQGDNRAVISPSGVAAVENACARLLEILPELAELELATQEDLVDSEP